MAVLEAGAFGLLFLILRVLSSANEAVPSLGTALGASSRGEFLLRAGLLALSLFVLRAVGNLHLLRVQSRMHASADAAWAKALFERALEMPYVELVRRNSADIINTITYRVPDVAANAVAALVTLAADTAVLAGIGITLFVVQPVLAAGVLLYFAAVAAGLLRAIGPVVRRAGDLEAASAKMALQILQEGIGGVKAIKANETADFFRAKFASEREALFAVRAQRVLAIRLPGFFLETAMLLGVALLAAAVATSGSQRIITTFGLVVAATFRTLPAVSRIVGAITGLRASEASVDVLADMLRDMPPTEVASRTARVRELPFDEYLSLEGVSVRYPGADADAIADMSFRIPFGTAIGVVGPSGSGKTTLVDCILGLLPLRSGRIVVDDEELTPELFPSWRHKIGYVPQDVFLLDGSLRDNVRFGRMASDEEIWTALSLAVIDELAQGNDGLDRTVGERGTQLSGGQRQRLGIARALLTHPRLLILDEATSALDNETESAITTSLALLRTRVTTLVIAHRLSTVRNCDLILFIEQGRLRSTGSFDQLLASDERFRSLVALGRLL